MIKILWVDDEIEYLQPHIRFLQKRNYLVQEARSGREALELLKSNRFDLVLMDQMMVGMDGLETVLQIRKSYKDLPVVMVTQSEEEELMDKALAGTIADYLTKPVNPSQILLVIKRLLDSGRLKVDKAVIEVVSETEKLRANANTTLSDWTHLYHSRTQKDINLGGELDSKLQGIQGGGLDQVEMGFSKFIENNYPDWIASPQSAPVMAHNVLERKVLPEIQRNSGEVVFLIIDCMRHDQWLLMAKFIEKWYHREPGFMVAGIPSATPYSRNSIFSGLVPRDIWRFYRTNWVEKYGYPGLNSYEQMLLNFALTRLGDKANKPAVYVKVSNRTEGDNLKRGLSHFLQNGFLAIVVNFIDHLTHGRSELDLIRDVAPDVVAFRKLAEGWFEHSFLYSLIKTLSARGATIIVTSDHGSMQTNRFTSIRSSRGVSHSVRYRFGQSLYGDPKATLLINNPADWGLPNDKPRKNYLIGRDDYLLMLPDFNKEDISKFKGSFQHGGISIEEMLVPCEVLRPKKYK